MGFLIVGIVIIVVGVVLWIQKGKRENKLNVINEYESSTVKMIRENYAFIEEGYGKGNFSNFVEVKGYAAHGEPLVAQLSGVECVYYHAVVVEEFEEKQAYTDQNGNRKTRWVKRSRVVQDLQDQIDFDLDDETGLILIELNGAELITKKVYETYEQGAHPDFNRIKSNNSGFVGSLLNAIGSLGNNVGKTRVLGYKFTEEAIPIDSQLYVIGEANDRNQELSISAPKEKEKPFIVSMKSEDEISKSLQKKIQLFKIGALACFIIGLGLIVFSVFYKPTSMTHQSNFNNQFYQHDEIEDFDNEYY